MGPCNRSENGCCVPTNSSLSSVRPTYSGGYTQTHMRCIGSPLHSALLVITFDVGSSVFLSVCSFCDPQIPQLHNRPPGFQIAQVCVSLPCLSLDPSPPTLRPIWIHGNLHVRTACVVFKVYMTGLTLDIESVLSSIYGLDNEGLLPPLKGIKTFSVPFGVFRVGFEMFVSVDSVEKVAAMMNHDFLIRFAGMYPRKIKMCTSICNTQIQTMSFSSQNLSITSQNLSSFGA